MVTIIPAHKPFLPVSLIVLLPLSELLIVISLKLWKDQHNITQSSNWDEQDGSLLCGMVLLTENLKFEDDYLLSHHSHKRRLFLLNCIHSSKNCRDLNFILYSLFGFVMSVQEKRYTRT